MLSCTARLVTHNFCIFLNLSAREAPFQPPFARMYWHRLKLGTKIHQYEANPRYR